MKPNFTSNPLLTLTHRLVLLSVPLLLTFAVAEAAPEEIQLLVRGDDMGVAQAANEACLKSYTQGIVRSVEVIVPGGWFPEAARLLEANPGLDVGVHLCLTSEWERCKWRPLTAAPSLVDEDGFFRPMTSQRKDFPPNTGFLEAHPKLEEVERELRAQIELLKKHVPRVSHVSAHMGTATCTPELKALTQKLAQEYHLRLESTDLKGIGGFRGVTAEEREESLVTLLEKLQPGRWLLVEHPGLDTPEMRGLGHLGYYHVAAERDAVTKAFTSEKVKQVIRRRGIKLISYAEIK